MTSEHPQRCETCKHRLSDCDKEYLCSRICKKIFLEDPGALQIGLPYFIDIVGCASHSSADEPMPPLVPDGTIISVDEDCNIKVSSCVALLTQSIGGGIND